MNVEKMRHQMERIQAAADCSRVASERRAAAKIVAIVRKYILRPDESLSEWQVTYLSTVMLKVPPLPYIIPRGWRP